MSRSSLCTGERGRTGKSRITLLVHPAQAEQLKLAMQEGSISMVLRNPLDVAQGHLAGTRLSNLSPTRANAKQMAYRPESEEPEPEPVKMHFEPILGLGDSAADSELWETVIYRGGQTEIKTFKIDRYTD